MKKLVLLPLFILMTGCAIGSVSSAASAVSAYSLRSDIADSLTAEGEYELIEHVKEEVLREIKILGK